jgi:uncharacterized phiE125 gp8 family phage protein
MRSLTLTETSPAQTFTEPLTRVQVEEHLSLPTLSPVDAQRDALLDKYITGAREQAEVLQGRDLVQKQWDRNLDCFPDGEIGLRPDLISVALVRYTDYAGAAEDLTENTDYIVDLKKTPGIIMPAYGKVWPSFTPWPSSAVLIRFTAGLSSSAVPKIVLGGMLRLISHWFYSRLPFELGASAVQEYPYSVTGPLRYKAVRHP